MNKLVLELSTLYKSSEQQLQRASQEGAGASIDTAQPAELIKTAKKLLEHRVSHSQQLTALVLE